MLTIKFSLSEKKVMDAGTILYHLREILSGAIDEWKRNPNRSKGIKISELRQQFFDTISDEEYYDIKDSLKLPEDNDLQVSIKMPASEFLDFLREVTEDWEEIRKITKKWIYLL